MVLADITVAGKPRKVVMQAPKNGFFYVLDRVTGELLSAEKYTTVTWPDRVDLKTGLFSGPALDDAITAHWNMRLRLDLGRDLRLTADTFLGGMAWYLGRVVRSLVKAGHIDDADLVTPAFALCGRGAGIFKRMHAGREASAVSEATSALEVFSAAAGRDVGAARPQLFTTPDAKLEVVRGMIASSGDNRAMAEKAQHGYVAGLGVELAAGSTIDPDDMVDRSTLSDDARLVDLSELKAFLNALREATDIEIDLLEREPQGAHRTIQVAVLRAMNDFRVSKDLKAKPEPPFIIALRALVDIMAAPAAERARRVRMGYRR